MAEINWLECCAFREIHHIDNHRPDQILTEVIYNSMEEGAGSQPASFIFTSTHRQNNFAAGKELAAYISRRKLGKVVKQPMVTNPRTGSKVIMWIWNVNWKAMLKTKEMLAAIKDAVSYGLLDDDETKEELDREIKDWQDSIPN